MAPLTSAASTASAGMQGWLPCRYRPAYHSRRASSAWSASVFFRFEVISAMAREWGFKGSAVWPLCINSGATPVILNFRGLYALMEDDLDCWCRAEDIGGGVRQRRIPLRPLVAGDEVM